MATCLVQDVYDDVRGILSDNPDYAPTGQLFPNSYFVSNKNAFGEPYRSMFAKLAGGSKRVQRVIYVVLPQSTTVLIPSTYGIVDFSEPEMIEERPAGAGITVTGTDTSTPIIVNAPGHGLGNAGNMIEGQMSQVVGTSAPWGNWFVTVIDANHFSLNGSASDGTAGSGGFFYVATTAPFTEVQPIDLTAAGLDGQPSQVLGVYLWINEMLQFRAASTPIQLRITYYASGTAPTNPNYVIGIDNCRDFLSVATAANIARAKQWFEMDAQLRNQAYYGNPATDTPSLLDLFFNVQVMSDQRGPARRQFPFRNKRTKFGTYLLG